MAAAGRSAAELLWQDWDRNPQVEDPRHPEFASAALEAFERLQREMPGVFRDVLRHAEAGAEQLTVNPFHGVFEVMQNADDLGASELRVAVRRGKPIELLFVHDGARVEVQHVLAMAFAFLSTKRGEARSKGRFGVGLKTLNQIGDRLTVSCAPYHFSIEQGRLAAATPAPAMRGLFDFAQGQTMLRLRMRRDFDLDGFMAWFREIDAADLLFLDAVRRVALVDARSGKPIVQRALSVRKPRRVPLRLRTEMEADVVELADRASRRRRWTRYTVEYPVPSGLHRAHKAKGPTTPLSLAVPDAGERGRVCAGLPLAVTSSLPFSVNAQFDPDTGRMGIRHVKWNEWLLDRLGDLAAASAADRFEERTASGWACVPTEDEALGGEDDWLRERWRKVGASVRRRVASTIRIETGGVPRRLDEVAYEAPQLTGIVSAEDVQTLLPGRWLVRTSSRDREQRWRSVLASLKGPRQLSVLAALELLRWTDERLGERPATWFIRLAAAAISAGDGYALADARSVVTANGLRVCPEAVQLVAELDADSLEAHLGVVHPIAAEYLGRYPQARQVRAWLEEEGYLSASVDLEEALRTWAQSGSERAEALALSDEDLLRLRTRLESMPEQERSRIGAGIGAAVLVDGYQWRGGTKAPTAVRPAEAYLPREIEKVRGTWGQAAGKTDGILWIDPRYATVLRVGRDEADAPGARALFRLLGAEIGPRLIRPNGRSFWVRDEIGYSVVGAPEHQRAALEHLRDGRRSPTHLLGDWDSPDLAAVAADIARSKLDGSRRERARALLETLERSWGRLYADRATARAAYSDGWWRAVGRAPATWLAAAASERWMTNRAGAKRAPRDLTLLTATTQHLYGRDRSIYAHEVREEDARSPVLEALGITREPPASGVLQELEALRDEKVGSTDWNTVHPLYRLLARYCGAAGGPAPSNIDDVPLVELRRRFGKSADGRGLLLISGNWVTPSETFRGRPIFGHWAPFVPDAPHLSPLWDALNISEPTPAAAVAVLERIAASTNARVAEDRQPIADSLRFLADRADSLGSQKRRLARLPLWVGDRWQAKRPVYAVADRELADGLRDRIPIWEPGFAIETVRSLTSALGITYLDDDSVSPLSGDSARPADSLTVETFARAVAHLQAYLASEDPGLWSATDWARLRELELMEAPALEAAVAPASGRKRLTTPKRVHLDQTAGQLFFRSEHDLAERRLGGRAIAQTFEKGRREIALAWAEAWREAEEGEAPDELRLAEDEASSMADPLGAIEQHGKRATGRKILAPARRRASSKQPRTQTEPIQARRELKSFDQATIATVEIVHGEGTKLRAAPRRIQLRHDLPIIPARPAPKGPRPSRKDWTDKEKEDLGFALLQGALKNLDGAELGDYRALRGVGADSIDNLRRFFELKTAERELPDHVRFEPSEFQRAAKTQGGKYFLAVVAGLEEGWPTRIRIIANPLDALQWRRHPAITLSGIRNAQTSLDIHVADGDEPESTN